MSNPLKRYVETRPKGWQAELARRIGVSRGVICDIVQGRREPTMDQARALDRATGGAVAFSDWLDPASGDHPRAEVRNTLQATPELTR